MSSPESPLDANQPQYFSSNPPAGAYAAPQKRPGGLTAVCVISIVLGVLGLRQFANHVRVTGHAINF